MRGKRELPRKRPPILLFVLIFAAGFLAGTLFWHFRSSGASVPSGGTVTLPEGFVRQTTLTIIMVLERLRIPAVIY